MPVAIARHLRAALALALLVALAGAAGAYWFFGRPPAAGSADYAALLPAGPIACPPDPHDFSGIAGSAPAVPAAAPAVSAAQTCTGLQSGVAARFDSLATRIADVPADGFDPAARAAEFATPEAAFAFVRDAIHTEGYAGAMRGASGTLQSLAGSPADKALLLAALLAHQRVAVRFVHATLGDADLAKVVAAVAAPPPAPVNRAFDAAFRALGIEPAQARVTAGAARKRVEDDATATLTAARAATDDLLATLASKNVNVGSDGTSAGARWGPNLHDHWWLQAQENGNWVDLDPALPAAKRGTHLGGPPEGDPVDSLPDEQWPTLTVRLTADRFVPDGDPQTTTLVERTVRLADAYAVPLTVTLGDRSAGADKLAEAAAFTPSIGFDGDDSSGDPFDTRNLAVVRLQVETDLAGTVDHVASRVVLDARNSNGDGIDSAWDARRYAYALTTVYEVLPVAGEIDPAFAGQREAAGMQSLRAFMAYAAAGGDGKQMPPPGVAEAYPIKALRYFEYDALTRRLLEDASQGGVRFAFDRPQIAIERHGFDASGHVPAGIESFDVADNAMLAAGRDRAASVRANLTRGYVDTEAEQRLFAGANDGGTIALFADAKRNGVGFTLLQGERYGGTALAPVTAVALGGRDRTGWWAVDVDDGNLVGRMGPDGAGQELSEFAIARANDWSTLYSMLHFYGDFYRCIAGTAETPLAGVDAPAVFKSCAGTAICAYLEGLSVSEAYSRWGTDEEALTYDALDLRTPGTNDSWPPAGGAVCSGLFTSPLYP